MNIADITKPRETVSPSGMLVFMECIEHREVDGAVWTLWRKSIGPTRCGLEIECAFPDGVVEAEGDGFTRTDCPVEWLHRTMAVDMEWRSLCTKRSSR